MKIITEIELDFISEDSTVSEEVEQQIISSISNKLTKQIETQLKPKMDTIATTIIDTKINDLLENYMNQPVVISTGWNKQENYESLYKMVETKFSSLYDEKLRISTSCNEDPIYKKLEEKIKYFVAQSLSRIDDKIKQEAQKIAKEAIDKNNTVQALKQLHEKRENNE